MSLPSSIRIGCSGWVYRHWREAFYPAGLPVNRWFAHYADAFDTVEINNSFYRWPTDTAFTAWRDQAPAGFRYAVKANRFLTQAKKLKDCAEPLQRTLPSLRALGPALGPVLFQLPPRFRLNLDRLRSFLELLPGDIVSVFEFRDPSWNEPAVLDLLAAYRAGFCAHDLPGLGTPRWAAGPVVYVRFHGAAGKYWGRYPDAALLEWADWMLAQARGGREVWAYFNNDANADAIHDALTLRSMVRQLGSS
jgi:uncharacterized protein YecE (DUF72 family)